ncbi:glutamate-cysteine ligase family protein [Peptoniphilus equinus]|uniref:glutamate--cysteine ligase n=1 Tax=Peptoniphilus equinus TaxID=3016343 RepID=A0ABY7QSC3_9FIRM|nr:glutamate-cysteine ligase family protein [Peptoniphilus equinus]WBW49701.1 glutamate-cysteine ligase family protein [Peptoniphilus equinus]
MDYNKQLDRVIQYFKSGEVPESDYAIGCEFEHFVLDKDTLEHITYYGDSEGKHTIEQTLHEIAELFDAVPYENNGKILGCDTDEFSVSLEPGSQFEISITAGKSLEQMSEAYRRILGAILPIFEKHNQILVPLGYNPVASIDDIKLIPKIRYDHMFNHFHSLGGDDTMGWNMMKGTASVQATIDYCDEEDFKSKYFLGSAIAPILYAAFDNAYIFEKAPYEDYNIRQTVWEKTDTSRSGLLPLAFDDLSYKSYAEFILNTTPIFEDVDGEIRSVDKKPFKELFDPDKDGDDAIFHAISIVFPDLRLKTYLEFRMMDGVNYPLNFAALALVKGLFYSKDNLKALHAIYDGTTYADVMKAKDEAAHRGLQGVYNGLSLQEHLKKLYDLAHDALGDEAHFLEPLQNIIESGNSPKDVFKAIYEAQGLRAAIDYNRVDRNV